MKYDVIIVGAGIVGLACALKILAKKGTTKLLIIEKEGDIVKHQTGNNSGVIHSGIYYKPGSYKAKNCRDGYSQLLEFCNKENIKYDICGKVIVATHQSELERLENLYNRGIANGIKGIKKLSTEEIKEREPYASGVAGIFVPDTGIIDYKEVGRKYLENIKRTGGEIKLSEEVTDIRQKNGTIEIITSKSNYQTDFIITCAGLHSDRIAKKTNPELPLIITPFRGEYYKIKEAKRDLVKTLIYPVPDPAFPFLGVHFTRMIDGKVEAGPNAVLAFKREGYKKTDFSLADCLETFLWPGFIKISIKYWQTGFGEFYRSFSKRAFVKALQRLLPAIQSEDLEPGGAGIRAQACDRKGGLVDDFYFAEGKNILHVCNAPSPAATASLAIGDFLADKYLSSVK